MVFGPAGFLVITPFVFIAAITNSNGSLYISLSSQFGNATDTGAISVLSLNDGPFFTLVALGATGLASIPFMSLVATLVPILIGFIWGNVDKEFRKACATASIITLFLCPFIVAFFDNSGFLTNLAGLSVIITGGMRLRTGALRLWEALAFVALGICIIAWTPLMLYLRARKLAGA